MSEPSEAWRARTLARFAQHREAWQGNEALRAQYERWYGLVREALPPPELGSWVELGSGPGFARDFIRGLALTDVVQAPWHDREVSAEALPYEDGSLGALVLFDVLHHLPAPGRFFGEAARVLRVGGRVVLCEPYVSALSYPIYRFFHDEDLSLGADPFTDSDGAGKDPFSANQALPTLLFVRRRTEFERRFPAFRVLQLRRMAGPSYPVSGGFSRRPFLPLPLWRKLLAVEDRLPEAAFRFLGFRLFVVLERKASP